MTTVQPDISPPGKSAGTRQIAIPKGAHNGLRELYAKALAATNLYQTALNATVAALGLDPKAEHSFDIAAGVITVSEAPTDSAA